MKRSTKYYVQNAAIIVLALAIIVMSVGYAAYSTDLTMTGTAVVKKSKWEVKFENAQVVTANTTVPETDQKPITIQADTNGVADTVLDFNVTMGMNKTYQFTVDVTNGGTFDAKLSSFALTGKQDGVAIVGISDTATSFENSYLQYDIRWNDNSNIATGNVLPKGQSKKLLVTVKTVQPEDYNELPTEGDVTYNFTFQMNFAQNDQLPESN